jgi:hypothetical protein
LAGGGKVFFKQGAGLIDEALGKIKSIILEKSVAQKGG